MVVVAFSSHQRVVGEGSVNHSPPAHLKKKIIYLVIYLFIIKGEDTFASTSFTVSVKGHVMVAKRAETTLEECSLTSCLRDHFPSGFPCYTRTTAYSAHSDFVW